MAMNWASAVDNNANAVAPDIHDFRVRHLEFSNEFCIRLDDPRGPRPIAFRTKGLQALRIEHVLRWNTVSALEVYAGPTPFFNAFAWVWGENEDPNGWDPQRYRPLGEIAAIFEPAEGARIGVVCVGLEYCYLRRFP